MDNYLEQVLLRQKREEKAGHSEAVLEKLKSKLGTGGRSPAEISLWASPQRSGELPEADSAEKTGDGALTRISAQLTAVLREELVVRSSGATAENRGDSAIGIRYGVIPQEGRQEDDQEQGRLSMDAVSRYFERDARRYPG